MLDRSLGDEVHDAHRMALTEAMDATDPLEHRGKTRLARFMESVESVTSAIPPAPPAPEPEPPPPAGEPPMIQLSESGVAFLQQLAAALPAPPAQTKPRRIETRRDEDGSMYLAVPMPSREALTRFTDGLQALLRSMQR